MSTVRVTLLSKPGCHLCDEARSTVTHCLEELGDVLFEELSILDDAELNARYWDEIPVVLIDDRVHTIWRVDPARLSRALLEASH